MGLYYRFVCDCGETSEWMNKRFSASAERDLHQQECDRDAEIESEFGTKIDSIGI